MEDERRVRAVLDEVAEPKLQRTLAHPSSRSTGSTVAAPRAPGLDRVARIQSIEPADAGFLLRSTRPQQGRSFDVPGDSEAAMR